MMYETSKRRNSFIFIFCKILFHIQQFEYIDVKT